MALNAKRGATGTSAPGQPPAPAPEGTTTGLVGDFRRALVQAGDRRFLGVLALSVGASIALLLGFSAGLTWLVGFLPESFTLPLVGWEVDTPFTGLQGLAVIAVLLASVFLMIPVSAVFVNLFIERIVDAVELRWYGGPSRGDGRGVLEQAGEAARLLGIVVLVNIAVLVLSLFTGPVAPFLFIAANGYLLGREFFETVAARMMPARDARALRQRHRIQVWLAGMLMTVPLTIPVMNLLIPVLGVASFTHTVHRLKAKNEAPPA
ncbi:MAG: EI24 domain-containing protein [Pseudomonadota bacterium]